MSTNNQLSRFYKAQGLTGKHLRSALKYDRKAVRVNRHKSSNTWSRWTPRDLCGAFVWAESPQGHNYWEERDLFRPD